MNLEEIKQRMHNGSIYYENSEIGKEQKKYNELLYDFNQIRPSDEPAKQKILAQLLGALGENVYIEAPLRANWGANTYIGNNVYANFNLTNTVIGAGSIVTKDIPANCVAVGSPCVVTKHP